MEGNENLEIVTIDSEIIRLTRNKERGVYCQKEGVIKLYREEPIYPMEAYQTLKDDVLTINVLGINKYYLEINNEIFWKPKSIFFIKNINSKDIYTHISEALKMYKIKYINIY